MSIGEKNRYIQIQAPTEVDDGQGGYITTWVRVADVYAKITPLSTHRKFEAAQSGINASHEIKIRYRNPMKTSWRFSYRDRYFAIGGIKNEDEADRWLIILALEASQVENLLAAIKVKRTGSTVEADVGGRFYLDEAKPLILSI